MKSVELELTTVHPAPVTVFVRCYADGRYDLWGADGVQHRNLQPWFASRPVWLHSLTHAHAVPLIDAAFAALKEDHV